MSSPLDRLSRALAGGIATPQRVDPPPAPAPSVVADPPRLAQPIPAHARLLTAAGETRSIRAWAMQLGLDRRTLAYRLNHGWSTDEALGFTPRHRDHAAEQAPGAESTAKVLVVDGDNKPIPRREAAALLGIQIKSLTHRLRRYRPPAGAAAARIPLSSLMHP